VWSVAPGVACPKHQPPAPLSHLDRILIATANPGKLEEYRRLLQSRGLEVLSSADVGAPEVEEDALTLEENALKKARALFDLTGIPSLGDDTGLEVTALDGRPGVFSARYAGPDCDPAANVEKLLNELQGVADRSARFRTVVAFVSRGIQRVFEGVCPGTIVESPRGARGFGYDPIFLPEGESNTFAQLTPDRKNRISHRGRALQTFVDFLHS
jgi:XTP/dITP diphosphohydrolase